MLKNQEEEEEEEGGWEKDAERMRGYKMLHGLRKKEGLTTAKDVDVDIDA